MVAFLLQSLDALAQVLKLPRQLVAVQPLQFRLVPDARQGGADVPLRNGLGVQGAALCQVPAK